jgi:enamine deaminase RidA (YjgF/YER057c/UK114 family)
MALFADFNKVYAERFGDTLPTRSLVEAKLAKNVDVEIEVQAWLGDRA